MLQLIGSYYLIFNKFKQSSINFSAISNFIIIVGRWYKYEYAETNSQSDFPDLYKQMFHIRFTSTANYYKAATHQFL